MIRSTLLFVFTLCLATAQNTSGWKIAIEPKGNLKASGAVPVQVMVNDSKGEAVTGADVQLVLTMVDMDHGETKFSAKQTKPGVYEATPKFMMDGKWNIEARVKKGSSSQATKKQVNVAE